MCIKHESVCRVTVNDDDDLERLLFMDQRIRSRSGLSTSGGMMQNSITSQRAPRKVLIVEDNMLNMKLFNDLLEAHGYTTFQTQDGHEVLRVARQFRPDLILMDIQLPEISGLEIAEQLKADGELRDIPIVAVTAFAMPRDEEKIRQAGCDGYLTKPISIAGFMQAIERYIDARYRVEQEGATAC